ncbi:MAG: lipid II flippase MurJ, partial [Thermoguttaceae bacterium]
MQRGPRHPLITGTVITGLGTIVSRVLGMLRDHATASLLGAGGSPVADAFFFGFRIPNLFRRLFGEGALTASYLPVLTSQLDKDPRVARQLASVVVTLLTLALIGVVIVGEVIFGLYWLVWWLIWGADPNVTLQVGLAAAMLPYLLLICIAAQLTTMLYAAREVVV